MIVADDTPACHPDTDFLEFFFHGGLQFYEGHILIFEAEHVEIGAQTRILRQPVFVVRFDTVHFAVLVRQVSHRAQHFIIIFHIINAEILGQTLAQVRIQQLVRFAGDPENMHARLLQTDREILEITGKMG